MRFKVVSWGHFPKEAQASLISEFKNNPYFHRKLGGLRIRFFKHSLIVFCPEVYTNSEAEGIAKMTLQVLNVLQRELIDRYDMKLSNLEICRNPHVAIVNNSFTTSLLDYCKAKGVHPDLGDFWVDESTDEEFETNVTGKAQQFIDNVMAIPKMRKKMLDDEKFMMERISNLIGSVAALTFAVDKLTDYITKRFGT
jgi:hypothetical protein